SLRFLWLQRLQGSDRLLPAHSGVALAISFLGRNRGGRGMTTSRRVAIAVAAVTLALPFIPGFRDFWITLAIYIGLFGLVTLGLVLLTGVGGMTSFGQATFVGFGAYATGVLSVRYGLSPWLALPV